MVDQRTKRRVTQIHMDAIAEKHRNMKTDEYIDESLPQDVRQLVDRCTIGETSFSNDEMSIALKFGELLWNRLHKMSQHYERESNYLMPDDIRGQTMKKASIDMNHVLRDTLNDM